MLRRVVPLLCLAAVSACGQQLTPGARRQIAALLAEKTSRTPAQAKLDSHLVHAAAILQGRPVHPDFPTPPGELESVHLDAGNQVEVDITAEATSQLLAQIAGLGGTVISEFPEYHAIRARLPLTRLEQLAGRAEVSQIRTADYGHSNAGPDTLGDIAHQAVLVRSSTGFDGSGVRIGVLSSGVNSLVAEQAAGRLPSTLNIIPGKAGNGDEGTAILEILYTLAPGATLYFATATGGQATMANNIQALADAGCNIILDDWTYFAEGVFQDDIIARKVNTLAAAGILYFSDAQNSGSVLKGNSGTWEGDFLDSGQTVAALAGAVHNFGSSASVTPYDALTAASPPSFNGAYELKWSDPLGGSSNDYDLFILDAGLTTVLGSSTNIQSGSQNPEEHVNASSGIPAGSRIIIVKHPSAAVRAMHLDTERGVLAIGTTGATFGHNAASGAFTMAAVDVQRANGGAFVGGASNYSYFYNSDGPRRMFYEANGTAVTPGNLLFATNGGTVLDKPDFTAADCVNTGVSGYTIFCGTSAAAPHAGAIAALVLQASPSIPVSQVRTAFTSAALDIEGPGWDINSGAGIVMAPAAVSAALAAQAPSPFIAAGGVVNSASIQSGVVANGWGSLFGSNLSSTTDDWSHSIVNSQLPTSLDGVSVTVGGRLAYISYVSPTQVNFLAPDVGVGPVTVVVTNSVGASAPVTVNSSQLEPAFFVWPGSQAVATHQDFSLAAKAGTFSGVTTVPAKPGEVIILWGTGFGPTSPAAPAGALVPSDRIYATQALPAVTVNNVSATVYGAALAPGFAGLYQVAIQAPASLGDGDWPVVASIGGVQSPSGVMLSVQR